MADAAAAGAALQRVAAVDHQRLPRDPPRLIRREERDRVRDVGRAMAGVTSAVIRHSDIGMPGQDGYALIRAIREREEGTPHRTLVITMTGFAARQDREAALRAGFDEHVAKPVDPHVLLARVRELEASRTLKS